MIPVIRFSWAIALVLVGAFSCLAEEKASAPASPHDAPAGEREAANARDLSEREKQLIKMLSGATLEGSFTNTSRASEATELSREKYTLGEVRKLGGKLWLIPARIEYGDKDVTLPITLPVEWAGDTPVVVVDNLGLPGFGTVSARVMFFADHYMGYWRHGASGGHLFGTIRRSEKSDDAKSDGEESKENEAPRDPR